MQDRKINITFVDTATGAEADAKIPDDTTREEILDTLVDQAFLTTSERGYDVRVQGRSRLNERSTLRDAGVRDGDRILISPPIQGGAR